MKKTKKSKKKRLSAIRDWRSWLVKPKIVTEEACVISSRTDTAIDAGSEKKGTSRRAQDAVQSSSLKRKLNLDRRAARNERRVNSNHNYKGPVRRYTIDRRVNLHDRRSKN